MGMFSWIYSNTNKAMIDGKCKHSFLLVPPEYTEEFGGHHIKETCYEGYGIMGGYDVYDLVAYWNRSWVYDNGDYSPKHNNGKTLAEEDWYKVFTSYISDTIKFEAFKQVIESYGYCLRNIGIEIACYDEDNEALENPIKIVDDGDLTYNMAYPSGADPNQGWVDDDEYYDDEYNEDDLMETLLYCAQYVIDEKLMCDETLGKLEKAVRHFS